MKARNAKRGRRKGKAVVPLLWRFLAWTGSAGIAAVIFAAFYHSQAHATNTTYHPFDPRETALFGFIFGVGGALVFKYLIIDTVLLRIAQKRSAIEIVREVAKDVAVTAAGVAIEGVVDSLSSSSSSSSSSGSSDGGGISGGGGTFGGGGASGGY